MRKQCEKCGTWVATTAGVEVFESLNPSHIGALHDEARCETQKRVPNIKFHGAEVAVEVYPKDAADYDHGPLTCGCDAECITDGCTCACHDEDERQGIMRPAKIKDITNEQGKILDEILDERERQDEKWGGPGHDASHAGHDWKMFIVEQASRLVDDLCMKKPDYRQRLIKIAALAMAAIEAEDKR